MRCKGWTENEIRDWYLQKIQTHGWAVVAVGADGDDAAFAYTLGLTRFHGHPELLVSGMNSRDAAVVLNEFGDLVGQGLRFAPGQLILRDDGHRFQLIPVDDPAQLVEAQELYSSENGPVPALQVVYSNHEGHWPWDRRWRGGHLAQPLFGAPAHR
jgi:Domain of unknown function (DUF4262)